MERKSFAKVKNRLEVPNLLESQRRSFKNFIDKGIEENFKEVFPIYDNTKNKVIEFKGYRVGEPKSSPEEAIRNNLTYTVPLHAMFSLKHIDVNHEIEEEVFMGDVPYMTDKETFIVNGNEKVVVSQVTRSQGVYFSKKANLKGTFDYEAKIMPVRGAWLVFSIDYKGIVYVKVDESKKMPATLLLKALGVANSNEELAELFYDQPNILVTIEKDTTTNTEEAVVELYKKMRPNDHANLDRAKQHIDTMFNDPKKYDMGKAGRKKVNKRLNMNDRVKDKKLVNEVEGISVEQTIKPKHFEVLNRQKEILIKTKEGEVYKIIGNEPLEERILTNQDIVATVNYLINLPDGIGIVDDIDHLSNRKLSQVGELLQREFQIGLGRVERIARERMNNSLGNQSEEEQRKATPHTYIHIKPLTAALKEFLNGKLSQYLDQVNPLAELSNKRRTSALGKGGMEKQRASIEVRDLHYSHFAKMCPTETPEGASIGLIGSTACYTRVDEYGILETPYMKVENGIITDEVHYLSAEDEDTVYIASCKDTDENGNFKANKLMVRHGDQYPIVPIEDINYVDVSTRQIVGVSANLIPFLEHDDANRAVMGANMQRQALPLIRPNEPIVGTGMEKKVALDTETSVIAKEDGKVKSVTNKKIIVEYKDGTIGEYKVVKFKRTNNDTVFNHRIKVIPNQEIKKGDVILDSTSSNDGELALGQNIIVAFMNWEGYNFEDAIVLNERLVREDYYTNISTKEFVLDVSDTKNGPEEVTRDLTQVGAKQKENLDENGIVKLGTKVGYGDILIGKKTPKSQEDVSPAERMYMAIFAEKAKDYKDSSLRIAHGKSGIVTEIIKLTKKDNVELGKMVNEQYKVKVSDKRKIRKGDKMAGRHGNKGVVSKILPNEHMPHLADGTTVDVVLNPLGVPSRMNLGQIMETHLGIAGMKLGTKYEVPIFDGASGEEISEELKKAGLPENGKFELYDGRNGEKFENDVTVGVMYFMKLNHQVKDKMHARSTGPYALVTQQPLGGKAQNGGQRFGEMEVWALEAYGAAYTLQEMLTIKSDDVMGRNGTYEAIVKGTEIPDPSPTEGFKVLISEIRSLGMNIDAIGKDGKSIFKRLNKVHNREF